MKIDRVKEKSLSALKSISSLFMLVCLVIALRCVVGLALKAGELVFGPKDYSTWLIMSAAEEPTETLLITLGVCVSLFAGSIYVGIFAEEKLEGKKTRKDK